MAAIAHLDAIGVAVAPPDPATDFEQLGADSLNAAWQSGAIHPISLRGMAAVLLAWLPQETISALGAIMTQGSREDREGEPPHRIEAMIALQSLDKDGLNSFPDEPLVSINPAASGRQIGQAAAELLKDWKQERGLSERRDRAERYDDYLRVWDLREGWIGGQYDRERELRLRDVAERLGLSIQTAHSHYSSAFALIVGHGYSPELWHQLFGVLKKSELIDAQPGAVSQSRPSKSRTPRPVPETSLCPTSEEGRAQGVVSGAMAPGTGHGVWELTEDILTLVGRGLTDEQIVAELDLSPKAVAAVAYIRKRGGEDFGTE
jgi:DNA-binding CsgD family transcriptional regulator